MASQLGVVHLAEPGSVLFYVERRLCGEGVHQASLATSKVIMQSSGWGLHLQQFNRRPLNQ
jgi:hypothetical protein